MRSQKCAKRLKYSGISYSKLKLRRSISKLTILTCQAKTVCSTLSRTKIKFQALLTNCRTLLATIAAWCTRAATLLHTGRQRRTLKMLKVISPCALPHMSAKTHTRVVSPIKHPTTTCHLASFKLWPWIIALWADLWPLLMESHLQALR